MKNLEANKIYSGKHQEILKDFPENYFDSCVTDPPYGISFMNQHWDYDVPTVEDWKGILRVMKPGAHLLCACGTRTQHRMVVNIEDAGFEIRDVITWHYGSGFPKSLDISKAIDKAAGAMGTYNVDESEMTTTQRGEKLGQGSYVRKDRATSNPVLYSGATEAAKQWEGYGTALKPATEFWTLARKPLSENTVSANVLKWGTGGINIDGCRIETDDTLGRETYQSERIYKTGFDDKTGYIDNTNGKGRFPANVIFDEFTGKILDEQSGESFSSGGTGEASKVSNGSINWKPSNTGGFYDVGGASRFFYCPKADNYERNKGLEKFTPIKVNDGRETEIDNAFQRGETLRKNTHPTVKPIDLMRYLVKLITPKKGICLDPYCGSGTTLIGCKLELINFIGIDKVENHCRIAEARVAAWNPDKYIPQKLF